MQRTVRAMPKGGHALGAAEILVEDDVERPTEAVLGGPVLSNGSGEEVSVERQRADVEAALVADRSVSLDFGVHHGEGRDAGTAWLTPEASVDAEDAHVVDDGMVAPFDAVVTSSVVSWMSGPGVAGSSRARAISAWRVSQSSSHREEAVVLPVQDLQRDLGSAPHGIGGDEGAADGQPFEKQRDGGDRVGSGRAGLLAEHGVPVRRPGEDEVERVAVPGAIVGAPGRFAAYGDHLGTRRSAGGAVPEARPRCVKQVANSSASIEFRMSFSVPRPGTPLAKSRKRRRTSMWSSAQRRISTNSSAPAIVPDRIGRDTSG